MWVQSWMTAEGFESDSFIMKDKAFLALPFKKKNKTEQPQQWAKRNFLK